MRISHAYMIGSSLWLDDPLYGTHAMFPALAGISAKVTHGTHHETPQGGVVSPVGTIPLHVGLLSERKTFGNIFFFLRNTVQHRRSHTRAHTHPYERTHAHPTPMSTSVIPSRRVES